MRLLYPAKSRLSDTIIRIFARFGELHLVHTVKIERTMMFGNGNNYLVPVFCRRHTNRFRHSFVHFLQSGTNVYSYCTAIVKKIKISLSFCCIIPLIVLLFGCANEKAHCSLNDSEAFETFSAENDPLCMIL